MQGFLTSSFEPCHHAWAYCVQFGKGSNKGPTYQAVYNALEQSLESGGQLRGVLFWRWNEDGGSDENTVYTNDSTWKCAATHLTNPCAPFHPMRRRKSKQDILFMNDSTQKCSDIFSNRLPHIVFTGPQVKA